MYLLNHFIYVYAVKNIRELNSLPFTNASLKAVSYTHLTLPTKLEV